MTRLGQVGSHTGGLGSANVVIFSWGLCVVTETSRSLGGPFAGTGFIALLGCSDGRLGWLNTIDM